VTRRYLRRCSGQSGGREEKGEQGAWTGSFLREDMERRDRTKAEIGRRGNGHARARQRAA
jgi:hypothetical protein